MRFVKVLLLPSGHALSHVAKCLAVRERLLAAGHTVELAVSASRSAFLEGIGISHHVLPDLHEADQGPIPSFAWFRRSEHFLHVVREECALMDKLVPDRVLGVFRFTASVSTTLARVPFDSLTCGCMSQWFKGVLGFEDDDPQATTQRRYLETFYRRSAERVNKALTMLGLSCISDIRELLAGQRTFLWDTPEFQSLGKHPFVEHVGPMEWKGWPLSPEDLRAIDKLGTPLAVVSFGTTTDAGSVMQRFVGRLLTQGFHVAVACGGRNLPVLEESSRERVTLFRFAPLSALLDRASLLVCHGGQQTVFEALAREVPVAVLPFQPEQAQNGICLERIGAGARLVPLAPFWGTPQVTLQNFDHLEDQMLDERLVSLVRSPVIRTGLKNARAWIDKYQGTETLARRLISAMP